MSSFVDDLQQAAADVALGLSQRGYRLDFKGPSLWEVERFFAEAEAPDARKPVGPLLVALGGYVGEVLRRSLGGTWVVDGDPDGLGQVELHLRGDVVVWPAERVMKRFHNGAEDSVVAYAVGLGVQVGDPPRPAGVLFKLRAAATHDDNPSATRKLRRWIADRRATARPRS